MRELLIRPLTIADPEGIWIHTQQRWSAEQADRYLRSIADALARLRTAPETGRSAESIHAGYRSLHVGRHQVFYTYTDEAVSVRRVP